MKKDKIKLPDIQVDSFITTDCNKLNGGGDTRYRPPNIFTLDYANICMVVTVTHTHDKNAVVGVVNNNPVQNHTTNKGN